MYFMFHTFKRFILLNIFKFYVSFKNILLLHYTLYTFDREQYMNVYIKIYTNL